MGYSPFEIYMLAVHCNWCAIYPCNWRNDRAPFGLSWFLFMGPAQYRAVNQKSKIGLWKTHSDEHRRYKPSFIYIQLCHAYSFLPLFTLQLLNFVQYVCACACVWWGGGGSLVIDLRIFLDLFGVCAQHEWTWMQWNIAVFRKYAKWRIKYGGKGRGELPVSCLSLYHLAFVQYSLAPAECLLHDSGQVIWPFEACLLIFKMGLILKVKS